MSTTSRTSSRRASFVVAGILCCIGAFPSIGRATTAPSSTDVAQEITYPDSLLTVSEAGRTAQEAAYRLLGDRPFQAVLMNGQRAVMTASSSGTSPFTDVPIASISKLVTAMTVMRLAELGRLDPTSTLAEFFSPIIVPESWRPVTVNQLLTHTSGFSADRDRWFNDTYSSCFDAFRRIVQRDSPGAGSYEYSNTNFCALSLAVGSVSGPSYVDAAYRLVLRQLGIGRKTMDQQYANLSGAGGWRMSALDVARIVSALDPSAPMSPLLEATRAQMIQRSSYNYGLGVWIWDDQTWGHSGSLYRARSIAVRLASGRVVVILTQATFPESGLDLLPIAQQIDAAYEATCQAGPCEFRGLDPFNGMPTAVLGRNTLTTS